MSDLFIGEILVSFLLVPVLLRPFVRVLQQVEGLSALPAVALLLCACVVAGLGLSISFLPLFVCTILICVAESARFARFCRRLPTDWYPPASLVLHAALLVMFVLVIGVSVAFAPEGAYIPEGNIEAREESRSFSSGARARMRVLVPAEKRIGAPVVVLVSDPSGDLHGRETAAWVLATEGYTVVSGRFTSLYDYRHPALALPHARSFLARAGAILGGHPLLTDEDETREAKRREIGRLVGFVKAEFPSGTPLYAVADGSGGAALASFITATPDVFDGVAVTQRPVDPVPAGFLLLDPESGTMPENSGDFRFVAFAGRDESLLHLGEIAADDPLAARLLGGQRDSGRRSGERLARRVATWLAARRSHDGA